MRIFRAVVLSLVLSLSASPVAAAVTFDAAAENHAAAGTTIAVSITIGSLSNGVAVVNCEMATIGTTVISGISGAGATWAAAAFGTIAGLGNTRGEIWYGTTPSAGAQTVTITFSAALADFGFCQVQTFGGVNQTTPLASYQSAAAANPSIAPTAASGDSATSSVLTATGPATVSNCTTTIDASFNTGGNLFGGVAHCAGPNPTFTWATGASGKLGQGAAVQQAGGAAVGPPQRLLLGVGQ